MKKIFFHVIPDSGRTCQVCKKFFYAMKVIFANQFHDLAEKSRRRVGC